MVLAGSCVMVISPVLDNWSCAVTNCRVLNSGTADQVMTARAGLPPPAGTALKNTPPPNDGSRSSQKAAMLGWSARKNDSNPWQHRGFVFGPIQTNPLDETKTAVVGPPGPGNVKPRGCAPE